MKFAKLITTSKLDISKLHWGKWGIELSFPLTINTNFFITITMDILICLKQSTVFNLKKINLWIWTILEINFFFCLLPGHYFCHDYAWALWPQLYPDGLSHLLVLVLSKLEQDANWRFSRGNYDTFITDSWVG